MNARPPVWIGPRGCAALVVLGVAAGAWAVIVPWFVALGVAALVAVAAVLADALAIARAPRIARAVPASLVLAQRAAFTFTVVNRAAVPLRFAIFEAPVERVQVDAAPARGRVAPGATSAVSIGVTPRERGRSRTGVAFVWFESPLGFVRRRTFAGEVVPLRIRPDLSFLGGDLVLRSRLIEAGLRRLRRRGVGSEFESLRDYSGGDAFGHIDWKATARRGKLTVAQYEVERSQQIVLAIDAGRLTGPRLGDRRKIDYSVSAALGLLAFARLAGDRIGFHAFAARTLASIAVGTGTAHAAAIADALADLQPQFEEADYERAALELRSRYRKRSLIVVFTDIFDPIASRALLSSLQVLVPQHLVLVILMNDAALASARAVAPRTVADVYRAAVATTLVEERARAVAALRARGIGVVDVPAGELTAAVLDAYVELKTRELL